MGARSRLETRLDRALERSLLVMSAPAGHGKTSTIVCWLQLRGLDAAWVSVDERDADLTRFAAHVAMALDRVVPGVAAALFPPLTVPDRLPPTDLGEAFGESLYDLGRDAILVARRLPRRRQWRGRGVCRRTPAFRSPPVAHDPQLPAEAAVLSRVSAPLAKSRSSRAPTSASRPRRPESCCESKPARRLPQSSRMSVHASVGGWPAAIRLIAISRGANDAGPHKVVTEHQEQLLLDYLGEEVLARLPIAQRQLLLRASLVDRFNRSLLEALAADLDGQRIDRTDIERLRALELFREIPGLDETWFAYHPLFRAVLRGELERTSDTAAIAALHRTIAGWFAAAGLTQEAVDHLVEAGDVSAAASLIESRASAAFTAEDWQSIAGWLRSIPMGEIRQRPELLLASAWVGFLGGRSSRVAEVMQALRDPESRLQAHQGQLAEIALIAESTDGDPERWIAVAERAVASISASRRYRYGYAHMTLGLALTEAGRADEALARLAAFTERESARIDAASIRGYFGRTLVLWHMGRLSQCEQTAADQWQLATMNALPVTAGWGAGFLSFIAHERGHLAEGDHHLAAVIAAAERLHFDCVREAFFIQILTFAARGKQIEADRAIARLRELAISVETPHQIARVDSIAARVALMRGDLAMAQRSLPSTTISTAGTGLLNVEQPLLTRVKVLIAVGTQDALAEADALLAGFIARARRGHYALSLLESLAVLALLHEARGERAAATQALRESLQMAAPEGIVQRYAYLGPAVAPILRRLLTELDAPHARQVLAALESVLAAQPELPSPEPPRPQTTLTAPLSAREIEVLHCLAAGSGPTTKSGTSSLFPPLPSNTTSPISPANSPSRAAAPRCLAPRMLGLIA